MCTFLICENLFKMIFILNVSKNCLKPTWEIPALEGVIEHSYMIFSSMSRDFELKNLIFPKNIKASFLLALCFIMWFEFLGHYFYFLESFQLSPMHQLELWNGLTASGLCWRKGNLPEQTVDQKGSGNLKISIFKLFWVCFENLLNSSFFL